MSVHDIHAQRFDDGTQEKLEIYRQYLRTWLPVFLMMDVPRIQVFDFFAGPGGDSEGNPGSPLITKQTVTEFLESGKFPRHPPIRLVFNEYDPTKHEQLSSCLESDRVVDDLSIETRCMEFSDAFEDQYPTMRGAANLIFLDQYGFKQVSRDIFQRIVALPRTDLLFFISSTYVVRFKNDPEIRKYLPLFDEEYATLCWTTAHRVLANAYRRWLPGSIGRYYLAPFSIKKGSNIYGLVFGSGHPRGIEKFLKVAWDHGGDANFDIDDDRLDPSAPLLFEEYNCRTKVAMFHDDLAELVLSGKMRSNQEVFIYAIESGFLGRHAVEGLKKLVKEGKLPSQRFAISYQAWSAGNAVPIQLKDEPA